MTNSHTGTRSQDGGGYYNYTVYDKLGSDLRAYRGARGLTQAEIAEKLGFDQSYISKIERGQKTVRNMDELRRIQRLLELPDPTVEVISEAISLCRDLREAGEPHRASQRIDSLVGLLPALELADNERPRLAARAEMTRSVILGDLESEARLMDTSVVAARTALTYATETEDSNLVSEGLRYLGNELRKAGKPDEALDPLMAAALGSSEPEGKGAALQYAARALAELGLRSDFEKAIIAAKRILDRRGSGTSKLNAGTLGEVESRGLVLLGDILGARRGIIRSLETIQEIPQWRTILDVTAGQIAAANHDELEALFFWHRATAEMRRTIWLPHQAERIASTIARIPRKAVGKEARSRMMALMRHTAEPEATID